MQSQNDQKDQYLYTLTADQLRAAALKSPDVTQMPLTILYQDHHAEISPQDNEWTGLQKFHVDTNRQGQINHQNIRVPANKENKDIYAEFKSTIQDELKIDPQKINTSYSQDLMNLSMFPFNYNKEIGLPKGTMYTPIGMQTDIFREGDEVYCRTVVQKYAVAQTGRTEDSRATVGGTNEAKQFEIDGPVEVFYKLVNGPKGGMFALQHISTNSDFACSVFLGKTGLEAQMEREAKKGQILLELERMLIVPPQPSSKQMVNDVIKQNYVDALLAVARYRDGLMSAADLVLSLEGHKKIIDATEKSGQSFVRRHSTIGHSKTATYSLEKVIETAKQLACSEAAPTETTKYVESARKRSQSTLKEAPIEGRESTVTIHMRPGGRGSA